MESSLDQALTIVEHRKFKSDRKYPPFEESMENVAKAASSLLHKEISAYDICIIMTLLKIDRESCSHKQDNIIDGLAYLAMSEKVSR